VLFAKKKGAQQNQLRKGRKTGNSKALRLTCHPFWGVLTPSWKKEGKRSRIQDGAFFSEKEHPSQVKKLEIGGVALSRTSGVLAGEF